jgi:hypothetical protein
MTVDAIFWTQSQIAARDGVSRQAVAKMVARLVHEHKLPVTRDGRGNITSVSVAAYDELRSRHADPSKAQARIAPAPLATIDPAQPVSSPDSYDEALRQKTWIEADRARIRLQAETGALVIADRVAAAQSEAGARIASVLSRLRGEGDAICAAVARDGLHGATRELRRIEREMADAIATALDAMASDAGEFDTLSDEAAPQPVTS